ncbi:MAG: c-type cytochrome biogenesis protein CcmF, partial [Sulfuritalea sp.]|nr:c-type cytochrome biogenesis protein CcmF [Sulfuritalea sp.]
GPPYFNAVFVPVMVPLLILLAVGPLAQWKHADLRAIALRLRLSLVLAVIAGIALPLLMGGWTAMTAMSSLIAVWIAASGVFQIIDRLKTGKPPAAFWGMHLAHLGIAVFVIGVAMVGGYQEEKDVRMEPGDTVQVGGYNFRLLGVKSAQGPNYRASVGEVELSRDGRLLRTMRPEKRQYLSSQMPMTEAAIDAGLTRDVYVSLGEPLDNRGAWSVRVYYKPFVDWIWGGCLLMALGGLVAMSDRRYRLRAKAGVALAGAVAA